MFLSDHSASSPYYHDWFVDVIHAWATAESPTSHRLRKPIGAASSCVIPRIFVTVLLGVTSGLPFFTGTPRRDPLAHQSSCAQGNSTSTRFYDRSIVGGQQMAGRAMPSTGSIAWILDGLIIRGSAYISVGVGEILRLFPDRQPPGLRLPFQSRRNHPDLLHPLRALAHRHEPARLTSPLPAPRVPLVAIVFIILLKAPRPHHRGFAAAFNLILVDWPALSELSGRAGRLLTTPWIIPG